MWNNPNSIATANPNSGEGYMIGRVKDIVLGEWKNKDLNIKDPNYTNASDVGKIFFEILYTGNDVSIGNTIMPAYPIFSTFKQFPILGETVLIISGPSKNLNDDVSNQDLFYFPPYFAWNSVNHNSLPNLDEVGNFNAKTSQIPNYQRSVSPTPPNFPLGYTFPELSHIRNLQAFEGDVIIESRFGQSIRFGSTNVKSQNNWSSEGNPGDPITIIRNGQGNPTFKLDQFASTVEDINSDKSSIYLTAGQKINLSLAKFPLDTFGIAVSPIDQPVITKTAPATSNQINNAASQDQQSLNPQNTNR